MQILILDFGSQYTQLIARRVREFGVSAEIWSPRQPLSFLESSRPKLVVLSGGPSSVYAPGAPGLPQGFWDWQETSGTWVLGICYGMQLMVRDLGGRVERGQVGEFGRAEIHGTDSDLWRPLGQQTVWMSHGDETAQVPDGFEVLARSQPGGVIAMVGQAKRRRVGLQFHPEVTHTEHGGAMLEHFVLRVVGCDRDWKLDSWIDREVSALRERIGSDHVVCGLSGGVDSTVAATLVHRAVGDQLRCVLVDHGLLRWQERARVMEMFKQLKLQVAAVDASAEFLGALRGVVDPERKRKIIGEKFIRTFEKAISNQGCEARFLVQGTLYPDVIESSPGHRLSETIKTHHNVGGLPKDMSFELVEPLREMFKDEVRVIGAQLGLPHEFLGRHPFPGPGLAVRILGEVTPERVALLQRADEIFIQGLREVGLYDRIWQAFAVLLPVQTVGVQGDGRTVGAALALRAVTSRDGMTAEAFELPHRFVTAIASRICNEVRGINRVVVDVTSKPPATIEWE